MVLLFTANSAHKLAWSLLITVLVLAWLMIPVFQGSPDDPLLTKKQMIAWYVVPFAILLIYLWTR
jgi:hypothetical protein